MQWSSEIEGARETQIFVALLEGLPFIDAAYWLSTTYAALTADSYRRDLALYFTPPSIADRLIGDLKNSGVLFDTDRFVDPACGGAAFLAIVADRMRQCLRAKHLSNAAILKHAAANLVGIEVDPVLGKLSQHFLKMTFYREICASGKAVRFKILEGDSLRSFTKLEGSFDVVLCNPPFRKLSSGETEEFSRRFPQAVCGQPNLYALFIELTARLARSGGLVGLVTPTSYMSGRNFSHVRTFLLEQTHIIGVGIITDRERVYLDVQQETALTVFRVHPTPLQARRRTAISLVERSGTYHVVGRCHFPNSGASWPVARDASDVKLIKAASQSTYRLIDYGYSTSVGGFVWNRDLRAVYLTESRVPKSRRQLAVPLLWSSDIGVDGSLRFDFQGAQERQHRFMYPGRLQQFGVSRSPGVILQRVTSNDQPRRLIGATISPAFVEQYGGYIGENHTVILEQTTKVPAISPNELVELLASNVVDRYFRSISGSVNVSTFELAQLPLPNPTALRRKIDEGFSIDQAAGALLLQSHSNNRRKRNS
jgi:adenine-specific DNA-methyltransferase